MSRQKAAKSLLGTLFLLAAFPTGAAGGGCVVHVPLRYDPQRTGATTQVIAPRVQLASLTAPKFLENHAPFEREGTSNLFHRMGLALVMEDRPGQLLSLQRIGDQILVGAEKGLFHLKGERLMRLVAHEIIGSVWLIHKAGNQTLIGTERGLFDLRGEHLTPLADKEAIGKVEAIQQVGDRTLVGTQHGLFHLKGNRLTSLSDSKTTGSVLSIQQAGDQILIGAEKGLFRLEGNRLTRLADGEVIGGVWSIRRIGARTLVGTAWGLFRVEGNRLTRLADLSVWSIQQIDNRILIGTDQGLFSLEEDALKVVRSDQASRFPWLLHQVDDQTWISTGQDLFRYLPETYQARNLNAAVAFGTGTIAAVRFAMSPCLGLAKPNELSLIGNHSTRSPTSTDPEVIPGVITVTGDVTKVATATVGPLPAGTWFVRLAVNDGHGWEPVSDPVELRVAWTPGDYIAHHLRQAALWLAGAHTLLFLLLLTGTRRSAWCWRVVSDPVWGRAGLWWHAALRHIPTLQRWVLARWFDDTRHRDRRPYLPVPLKASDGAVLAADTLFERLRTQPRLWIQGSAGMGKTALVDELARQFFAESASLEAAFRRYGFIPIVVRLRDVLDIKADPAQPDRWVPEMARIALRANGLRVDDPTLFRAILESGSFALIIDGANETVNAATLEDYARTTPEVRILVTSQADPTKPGFAVLSLPPTVQESIAPLLTLFLGSERGHAVLEAVHSTPLWADLASGYDVRLLADLAGSTSSAPILPEDRIGLYRTLLARLRFGGAPYPEAELCQAAWQMWRDGVRRFDGSKYLSPDLIEPLRHDEARVVRTIGGLLHEFRHDQMRGYLAALWAAQHEVTPVRLFEQDKPIWRLSRAEQEVVWAFFAALIDPMVGEFVWQWCHEDPERAILQHALDQRGRQDGWALVRRLQDAGTETVFVQSHG